MELILYFIAMIGGSYAYEPIFLFKTLALIVVLSIVLTGVVEYLARKRAH